MSDLKVRTYLFARSILRASAALPRTAPFPILTGQLLRSATSVAANYRAARRARSRSEFIAKLGIVEEEADETVFWIDLLIDPGVADPWPSLRDEAEQLLRITVAARKTAKANRQP